MIPFEIISNFRTNLISTYRDFLNDKLYFEFGVANGISLLEFYNLYKINDINGYFYGFDSFLGLPEEKIDKNNPSYWKPGEYSNKGTINPNLLNKSNIKIIDGWFEETLTKELVEKLENKKIGLLHIDCDIYTSSYKSLDFCFENNLIVPGSLIVYDDWGGYWEKMGDGHEFDVGEGKAHKEIMEKYNKRCIYLEKCVVIPKSYEITLFQII